MSDGAFGQREFNQTLAVDGAADDPTNFLQLSL